MGKVDRLRNIIELFCCLVLCSRHCTLYNVQLYNTYLLTPGPARWPGINAPPYTKHFLIWSQVVQFSAQTRRPPLFISRYIYIIYI